MEQARLAASKHLLRGTTIEDAREMMVSRFKALGKREQDLERIINKPKGGWSATDMVDLKATYEGIKTGEITLDEVFATFGDEPVPAPTKTQPSTPTSADRARAKLADRPRPTPAPAREDEPPPPDDDPGEDGEEVEAVAPPPVRSDKMGMEDAVPALQDIGAGEEAKLKALLKRIDTSDPAVKAEIRKAWARVRVGGQMTIGGEK